MKESFQQARGRSAKGAGVIGKKFEQYFRIYEVTPFKKDQKLAKPPRRLNLWRPKINRNLSDSTLGGVVAGTASNAESVQKVR